jgi:hypothetical protein
MLLRATLLGQHIRKVQKQPGWTKQPRRRVSRTRKVHKQLGLIKNNLVEVRQGSCMFKKQLRPAYEQLETTLLSSGARHYLDLFVLTLALHPGARIQGQRTKNTIIQDYNNPTTTHQDPSSESFSKEKNLEKARGLQSTYPQRRLSNFFLNRPSGFLFQIARGSNCTWCRKRTQNQRQKEDHLKVFHSRRTWIRL